jgi:hypothetical protein
VAVPCHHGHDVDWLFGACFVVVLDRNHPIDHLDRYSDRGRQLFDLGDDQRREVVTLRLCGTGPGLGLSGLGGAMGEMVGLFLCSRLGGRWRCGSSLRCRGRLSRRLR